MVRVYWLVHIQSMLYVRRFDVVTQMNCYDPGVVVYRELSDVVSASWRALKSLE